jgi:hypothetical protein
VHNYVWFGIEPLLSTFQQQPGDLILANKRAFIFMPWVFLLGITICGKIGGIYGYFGSMGLIITWYF